MSRTTRISRASSSGYAEALVLEPDRSRLLAAWWAALHVLVAVSVTATALPWPLKLAAAAGVVLHAALRRPRLPARIERRTDGTWSMPGRGLADLTLDAGGGSVGPFWVRLRFAGGPPALSVLLLRDQLPDAQWRTLQAELRRSCATGQISDDTARDSS